MSECNHTSKQSCLRGDECAQCLREGKKRIGSSELVLLRTLRAELKRCLSLESTAKRQKLFEPEIAWRMRATGVQYALNCLKQQNDRTEPRRATDK